MAENQSPGTPVGTLSTTDPDAGDTFTYSLVSGAGSDNNGSFQIVGAGLQTSVPFNFEAKASYSIRVRSTDSTTRFFEKAFTVTVTNVNEAPTNIGLSPSSIARRTCRRYGGRGAERDRPGRRPDAHVQPAGIRLWRRSLPGQRPFSISGNSLSSTASFNYEAKSSYTICVRATDNGSPALSFDKQLTVVVTNVNETPTDISLSNASIAENQPSASTVGTLSTADPDVGDTQSYSLVAGTGSTDNGSFTITGTSLKTNAAFDFEAKSSYSIRVRSTDGGALFFEKVFTITVTNVNESPVNTVPGAQTVNEDTDLTFSAGAAISVADPDGTSTNVKLSLDVAHGTLTLASTVGLTFVDGTANGTGSVHVTGTIANLNAALVGLKYRGTANYNSSRGAESLAVVTNDQGNTGTGGAALGQRQRRHLG